jgi:hypothetical protein
VAGRHSKPDGWPSQPPAAALGKFLAVVVALGVFIYLLVTSSYLVALCLILAFWVGLLAYTVVQRIRRRSRLGVYWITFGLISETGWQIVSQLAHQHHWPAAQQHAVAVAGRWTQGFAIAWAVVIIWTTLPARLRRWPWRRGGPGAPAASPPGQS